MVWLVKIDYINIKILYALDIKNIRYLKVLDMI